MKRKKYICILCMVIMCMTCTISAHAADPYLDYGDADGKITITTYKDKYNDTWIKIIRKSIVAWNQSDANVKISVSSNSTNEIKAKSYDDTWYGLTSLTPEVNTYYVKSFNIKMNVRTIKRDATDFPRFARSTLVHEFGHVFWLCDNPNTTKKTIMSYGRDRNTMIEPQPFDIKNVNKKYN